MKSVSFVLAAFAAVIMPAYGQNLPAPSEYPLQPDLENDPVLNLRREPDNGALFRSAVVAAIANHPSVTESQAFERQAEAVLDEAKELRLPSLDASISSYSVFSRAFSNDPENILERSRPARRTDALLFASVPLFDFGASGSRIAAAKARIAKTGYNLESAESSLALNAIASWYEVFGYRAVVSIFEAFIENERSLRQLVIERIELGGDAQSEILRIDGAIAQRNTELARYRRLLANAEARFSELVGFAPPEQIMRAPAPNDTFMSGDSAAIASAENAAVRSFEAEAEAARQEAKVLQRQRLPAISARIDAGRFGVFETERDYDIRGTLSINFRLFGGVEPRIRQSQALAEAASARAERARMEASRDARIAWSDVLALNTQTDELEKSYITTRQLRDVVVTRFRTTRGTLFDVAAAEGAYIQGATAYIQTLIDLDIARYTLLFRTGRLLESLGVDPTRMEMGRE